MKKLDKPNSLKHKMHMMQAEAASISVTMHILFILLAGSIVAVRWINKEAAEFAGENIDRPKLERRQLQLPVKVKNLQKKSRRPKIKTRMAVVNKTNFKPPNMKAMENIMMDRDYGDTGNREFDGLGSAGSLGFGISGVNFFGIKSSGEKLFFVVDVSKGMMVDKKGGQTTFKYVKSELYRMVDNMKAATLFNVALFDENNGSVKVFSPKMLAATSVNRDELKKWLAPVNTNKRNYGLSKKAGNYENKVKYDSKVGQRARDWTKAAQAALEQTPDNIFILGSDWGRQWHQTVKQRRMNDAEYAEYLRDKGWTMESVRQRQKERGRMKEQAKKLLAKENAARRAKGKPEKVFRRGINAEWEGYMKSLGYNVPGRVPSRNTDGKRVHYNLKDIIEHVTAVYKYRYIPKKLKKPKIHFVNLVASDFSLSSADKKRHEQIANFQELTRVFRGRFEFLKGSKTMHNLVKLNPELDTSAF